MTPNDLICHFLDSFINSHHLVTGVDENEISLLVASVDLDKDGTLTLSEFSKAMFGARSKTA